MNRLEQLHHAGVSIWLDTLSRDLLTGGAFAALIADDSVTGARSNPTIVTGLERRVAAGHPVTGISSVASFFVSRVDAKVDARLPAGSDLRGCVASANAWQAYGRSRNRFADERWLALGDAGARPQRPLWASTGTKNPAYSDVLYVEELIAPDVINTMPEATLRAFADHGDASRGFGARSGEETLGRAEEAGVDLAAITSELEREGVRSFSNSYRELLDCIETKLQQAAGAGVPRS